MAKPQQEKKGSFVQLSVASTLVKPAGIAKVLQVVLHTVGVLAAKQRRKGAEIACKRGSVFKRRFCAVAQIVCQNQRKNV